MNNSKKKENGVLWRIGYQCDENGNAFFDYETEREREARRYYEKLRKKGPAYDGFSIILAKLTYYENGHTEEHVVERGKMKEEDYE